MNNKFKRVFKNRIMIALLLFCMAFSLSISAKTKIIKYNNNVYYNGEVVKKQPLGDGVLLVVKQRYMNNFDIYDKITGSFDGLTVTNGELCLSTGLTFKGNFSIDVSEGSVVYNLKNGIFDGVKYDGINYSFCNPKKYRRNVDASLILREPVQVQRDFTGNSSNLQSKTFLSDLSLEIVKSDLDGIWRDSRNSREQAYLLALAFADDRESATLHFTVETDISDGYAWDMKADDISIDLGDDYTCVYSYCPEYKHLTIKSNNGDTLEWKKTEENSSLIFKKRIKNCDNPYSIECISLHEDKTVYNQYNYIIEKLGAYISDELKERIKNVQDGIRKYNILISNDPYYYDPFKYTFSDGSYFIGFIHSQEVIDILCSKDIPNNPKERLCGIFTKPTGEQTIYLKGIHGWTLDAMERHIIDEKESIRINEQKEKVEKERERQKWNELYRKYGKKYVDALFKQGRILVGSPEGLIRNHTEYILTSEDQYTRTYRLEGVFRDWAATVTVDVKTKKVISVHNWTY